MRVARWFLSGLVLAGAAFGEPLFFQCDPAQTQVQFALGGTLHTVHGAFRLTSGSIRIDPASGTASGSFVVDARSGNSGSNGRDNRMHKSILESPAYPEITFTPDRVNGPVRLEGASDFEIHGRFTIHGAAHDLTAKVHTEAANGEMKTTVEFPVPYVKWGLKNPSTLFLRVEDAVQIEIHTVARLSPSS